MTYYRTPTLFDTHATDCAIADAEDLLADILATRRGIPVPTLGTPDCDRLLDQLEKASRSLHRFTAIRKTALIIDHERAQYKLAREKRRQRITEKPILREPWDDTLAPQYPTEYPNENPNPDSSIDPNHHSNTDSTDAPDITPPPPNTPAGLPSQAPEAHDPITQTEPPGTIPLELKVPDGQNTPPPVNQQGNVGTGSAPSQTIPLANPHPDAVPVPGFPAHHNPSTPQGARTPTIRTATVPQVPILPSMLRTQPRDLEQAGEPTQPSPPSPTPHPDATHNTPSNPKSHPDRQTQKAQRKAAKRAAYQQAKQQRRQAFKQQKQLTHPASQNPNPPP